MNTLLTKLFLLAVSACLVPRGVRSQCTDATPLCVIQPNNATTYVTPGVNFVLQYEFSSFLRPHDELIALFNTTYTFCGERSYTEGYSCRYKDIQQVPATIGNIFTVIVECADESEVLGVQNGTVVLRFRMRDVVNGGVQNTTCDAEINVEWMQTSCIQEEFHTSRQGDCSGIAQVLTPSGSNQTIFIVNTTGVASIGQAVLISNNSPFCGEETLNTSASLLCHSSNDSRQITDLPLPISLSSSFTYAFFICSGNSYIIPNGPSWIIFERTLTPTPNDTCGDLSISQPFVSDYTGFQIQWRQRVDYDGMFDVTTACEEVEYENFPSCLAVCVSRVEQEIEDGVEICVHVAEVVLQHEPLTALDFEAILVILTVLSTSSGPESLSAVVDILEDIVDELEGNINLLDSGRAEELLDVFDTVLGEDRAQDWHDLQLEDDKDASSDLLRTLEETGVLIRRALGEPVFEYRGENIRALNVARAQQSDILRGAYLFPQSAELQQTIGVVMEIPIELLCEQEEEEDGFAVYEQDSCTNVVVNLIAQNLPRYLDQITNTMDLQTNSLLLSTQFSDEDVPIEAHPITMLFNPLDGNFTDETCVFWSFNQSNWSSSGLETEVNSDGSTLCTTTHLTGFAVLVNVNGPELDTAEKQALKVVSYIGCGISIICLIFSLLIFIFYGKYLNKGVLLYIHLNFMTALLLGLIVFVAGIESALGVQWLCTLIAALLHYFFLCVFCWMLAEGIMLYFLLVRVFGKAAERWYYLLILGWGVPLPIVGISVGIRHYDYGTSEFCWLSTDSGTVWAFVGPMIFIILINSVFLVVTILSMVRSRKYGGAEPGIRNLQLVKTVLKSTVILLPLLGITWVLGLLAVNRNTTVFAWLFTIFNSLQGFFIFLFHVLRNDKVYGSLKRYLRRIMPTIALEKQDTFKDISSNMGTGITADTVVMLDGHTRTTNALTTDPAGKDTSHTTQYRLQTFERTLSDISQSSTAELSASFNSL